MAASIKMDELLVTWLSSDNVYENVLNLVESFRQEENSNDASSSSNPNGGNASSEPSPSSPSSPRRKSSSSPFSSHGRSKRFSDNDDQEQTQQQQQEQKKDITIPPFYRPPGTFDNGLKMKAIRRSRTDSFDSDQSWDGIYSVDSTSSSNSDPAKESADDSNSNNNNNNNTNTNTNNNANNNGTKSNVPIKEQVKNIFEEHGKIFTSQQKQQLNQQHESKYLTIDQFVKITKDICNFPTFFNKPLYKRILYLWNTQDVKSTRGKLIIWNEYYLNSDELDIGVDPNNEANAGNNDNNDDNKDSENGDKGEGKKKKKSNELLDQLDKFITYDIFKWYWTQEMEDYDLSERFFRLLKKPHENYVAKDDFGPLIKELLNDHPGLEFLSNHAEFQDKYAITVITRIFYTVNKCHSGRITSRQIRRSDLLSAFQQVDEEEDINKVTRYFSYEHFYVLYCRFWELDHDRDYKITREDLLKYADQSLSHMIVDRIFDAAPRPFGVVEDEKEGGDDDGAKGNNNNGGDDKGNSNGTNGRKDGKEKTAKDYLTYEDFIFFMLSEEDKANEISVRYWFSCLDVDGDGKLNNMEMRSFYALQQHRMQTLGHEHIPFEDMLCQMIDMIKPKSDDFVVVEDFLQEECVPVSGALFDALFNLNKYVQFEQRDPFQERQKREDEFETDWDRFACMDYNRLAMEEEAREEDAMEIDWVSVDDEDEDGEDFNMGLGGASEAPF